MEVKMCLRGSGKLLAWRWEVSCMERLVGYGLHGSGEVVAWEWKGDCMEVEGWLLGVGKVVIWKWKDG